ncbi:hypothetical protein J6590_076651 [Homalodisca vitripennis]|nr:hypothetical protein J6590_076651 [Homalodisca vitripennis]
MYMSIKLAIKIEYVYNYCSYMSIQSPQGLDPLQARKMADIRRNIQFIESQLAVINRDLSLKWTTFQESNKENRETVKIPSLEAIYQAMVLQNNVLMGQKKKLDSLEKEARNLNRKRLIKVMNVSRSMDDAQPDNQ